MLNYKSNENTKETHNNMSNDYDKELVSAVISAVLIVGGNYLILGMSLVVGICILTPQQRWNGVSCG
ncbi:MAG: hypothetical protein LBC74_04500 [Planctomycetaceae bacterium]|nr:hypothetical protein [Planctomycetaceae bacterium]